MERVVCPPCGQSAARMLALAVGLILGGLGTQALHAASEPTTHVTLVKAETLKNLPGMDGYVIEATAAPGAQSGWHVHPGHELAYVLEGEGILEVKGQSPLRLKKGVGFHIDPMVPHNAINTGTAAPLRVVAVFVVESGNSIWIPVK